MRTQNWLKSTKLWFKKLVSRTFSYKSSELLKKLQLVPGNFEKLPKLRILENCKGTPSVCSTQQQRADKQTFSTKCRKVCQKHFKVHKSLRISERILEGSAKGSMVVGLPCSTGQTQFVTRYCYSRQTLLALSLRSLQCTNKQIRVKHIAQQYIA